MPVQPGSPAARAMIFYGSIESAAFARKTTAQIWDAIRAHAASLGMASPGVGAAAVSVLRGYAGRAVRAAEAFAAADDAATLTAAHISEAPWARPAAAQGASPMHQVNFLATVTTPEGVTEQHYQFTVVQGQLPGTVGEMRDLVRQDAEQLAATGGGPGTPKGSLAGVSGIVIRRV